MVFDFYYDEYCGVIMYVWIMNGEVCKGDKIKFFCNDMIYDVLEFG